MQFMLNSTCKGHSLEVSIKRCLVTSLLDYHQRRLPVVCHATTLLVSTNA